MQRQFQYQPGEAYYSSINNLRLKSGDRPICYEIVHLRPLIERCTSPPGPRFQEHKVDSVQSSSENRTGNRESARRQPKYACPRFRDDFE